MERTMDHNVQGDLETGTRLKRSLLSPEYFQMIIGPSGEHEVVDSPICGQDFFLVSAEIVQRCRCASQIPQLGDGVVGSRQKKIVVGG